MCSRYTLRKKLNVLLSEFAAELAEGTVWEPRYNIPPTASVPAVRLNDGKRQLALFQWGLIPSWAKDARIAYSTINARADTVATKPAFRSAFKKRRCLVLGRFLTYNFFQLFAFLRSSGSRKSRYTTHLSFRRKATPRLFTRRRNKPMRPSF